MHWSLWGVSHLSLAKLVNCNQILGHVTDQDCIEFIDSVGFSTEHRFLLWCRCEVWDSYCEITLWIHSKFHSTQSTMNWSAFHWKHNCLSFTVRHYVTVPNKDNYRLPRKLPEGNVFSRVCSSVHGMIPPPAIESVPPTRNGTLLYRDP